MIAEAAATGKPLTIAPVRRLPSLNWRAEQGLARWLAVEGLLVPPRNVPQLVRGLSTLDLNAANEMWQTILWRIKSLFAGGELGER